MDIKKSLVSAASYGSGYSRRIEVGELVDLDAQLDDGMTMRDVFPAEYFEAAPEDADLMNEEHD